MGSGQGLVFQWETSKSAHGYVSHAAAALQHTQQLTHSPSSCTLHLHGNWQAWPMDVRNKSQRKGRERERKNVRHKEPQKDGLPRKAYTALTPPARKPGMNSGPKDGGAEAGVRPLWTQVMET